MASTLSDLRQDVRLAVRRIRRAPALAVAVILTIGVGLGAAAAIFTASRAALVEPLPYAAAHRLVHVWEVQASTRERTPTSLPTLADWRSRTSGFSALEAYDPANFTIGIADDARMLRGAQVTADFFRLLGLRMSAGRDFDERADATPGAAVALVTDRFAATLGDRSVPGRTITINGAPHTIVGVLPRDFHFALLQNADVFVPLAANPEEPDDRAERAAHVIGRLRDGVSVRAASDQLGGIMAGLAREHPDDLAGRSVAIMPLRDALLGGMKPVLGVLLAAVALLIMIMGANLALLTLTRYVARAPELVMRSALGATRGRILRQLLVESLVPAALGAVLAVALGQIATRAALDTIPEGVRIGMPYLADAGLDAQVIATIVGVATALAIGFGLGPALLVTRARQRAGDARTTPDRGDRRVRRGLVTAQVALTVVLLIASGLLVTSFRNLLHRDLGFRDPAEIVTARAPLTGTRYEDPAAQRRFQEALIDRSAGVPGVLEAGLVDEVPGGGGGITTVEAADRPRGRSMQRQVTRRIVGGAYFSAMGIPIVSGRAFGSGDRSETRPVAVISASLARVLGGAAPGARLRLAETDLTEWEVVGVAGDVQVAALDAPSPPVIYLSHLQVEENRMTLVLRTGLDAAAVDARLRPIVKAIDPGVPVYAITRLDRQLADSRAVFSRRFPMILCAVFGAAALALTLIALHAICSHEVLTRQREFGIRIALGGSPESIRAIILRDALRLGTLGAGLGAGVAVLTSRAMRSVLFGIGETDWRVYALAAAVVLAAALAASLAPALRAATVSPGAVMRGE